MEYVEELKAKLEAEGKLVEIVNWRDPDKVERLAGTVIGNCSRPGSDAGVGDTVYLCPSGKEGLYINIRRQQ